MEKEQMEYIASQIVDAGYRVHREIGPGLLESVYLYCFAEELRGRRIQVVKEVVQPLYYRGNRLNKDFRLDMLVENEIILEIKAVEILLPVHIAQIISYLKLSDKRMGFLFNFNVPVLREGIHRYVNKY
jgi:GxxExxY protein